MGFDFEVGWQKVRGDRHQVKRRGPPLKSFKCVATEFSSSIIRKKHYICCIRS